MLLRRPVPLLRPCGCGGGTAPLTWIHVRKATKEDGFLVLIVVAGLLLGWDGAGAKGRDLAVVPDSGAGVVGDGQE